MLNEERHIREAVAAFQAQEFDETAEFFFINAGSTDCTRTILLDLAREDARIRFSMIRATILRAV